MFTVSGDLPQIILNNDGLFIGDLRFYFKTIFFNAQNLQRGYHNFRHTFHVLWLCYQAVHFYQQEIHPTDRRNLLIAAMWHDFDHPGIKGNDDLNVERAVRGFRKHILEEDKKYEDCIVKIIRASEYPYKEKTDSLPLTCQIIRDADMGQVFAMAWLQQVVFGLSQEWGMTPMEILRSQPSFLKSVKFHTKWGQTMFPQKQIEAKIRESEELIELLA